MKKRRRHKKKKNVQSTIRSVTYSPSAELKKPKIVSSFITYYSSSAPRGPKVSKLLHPTAKVIHTGQTKKDGSHRS